MSEEHIRQEDTAEEASNILQSRPLRRQRRGLALLLSLLGTVLVVTVVALVAWQALSSHASTTGTRAASSSKGNSSASAVPPGWNDPAIYWDPIRTTVAQGLHLNVTQVAARLRAATPAGYLTPTSSNKGSAPDPGIPMTTVATQQGLSTAQLHTLELSALQNGCNAMVARGQLSQEDANQRMQMFNGWDQGTLNWYIMHAFTGQ